MTNPFQVHLADNASQAAPLGLWLADCERRGTPVAVALRDRQKKLCLATRDDAWVLDFKSDASPLLAGVLRSHIIDGNNLRFLARNITKDLREICTYMSKVLGTTPLSLFTNLAPYFVGDLTSAAHCINQVVTPMNKFTSIENDAFEVALLEPQYAHGIAAYYQKIGLPFARLQAESWLVPKKPAEWWVSYEHLWVRVLAFYTGDPTLGWAFVERRNPFEVIGKMFKCSEHEAELRLLWQVCGRDMSVFVNRFSTRASELPDDLTSWNDQLDRSMPATAMACHQMKQAYFDTHYAETLYKRQLKRGSDYGEAVAFRIFGTVEDIINVAAVAFWNNRPTSDVMITKIEGGPDASLIRVLGIGPQVGVRHQWSESMKQLSSLGNPLGSTLTLNPQVVQV